MTAKTRTALGTQADTDLANNTTKDISPADVRGMVKDMQDSHFNPLSDRFTSSNQTITAAGLLTIAHGLGATPVRFDFYLDCQITEGNWAVNDKMYPSSTTLGSDNRGHTIYADSTNVYIRFGNQAKTYRGLDKSTGSRFDMTNANWNFVVIAEL